MMPALLPVLVLLSVVVAFVLWLAWARLTPQPLPERPMTWRIVIPRDAQFSVSQATAWFVALQPLFARVEDSTSVELVGRRGELQLTLTAPESWEVVLRSQLLAWFPSARLEPTAPRAEPGVLAVQALELSKPEIFVLRLAQDGDADPALGTLGALTHSQTICGIRLTWRQKPRNWKGWRTTALAALKTGAPILPRHWPAGFRFLCEVMLHVAQQEMRSQILPHHLTVTAAEAKAHDTVFEAQLNVWSRSEAESDALAQVSRLTSHLCAVYREPLGNGLMTRRKPTLLPGSGLDIPFTSRWSVLSAAELASLFHLPISAHPLVPTEPGRWVGPVPELLHPDPSDNEATTWLGEAILPEGVKPIGIGPAERQLHLYVAGKTGTGKSTFLANIARQDLERGHGLALIDPHGDLAERVLSLVPPERFSDVLYFNAADTDYPIGFNLLSTRTAAERPLVGSSLVGVFKKLYGESWGPRLEYFLRNAVLTLLETPSPSLLQLPRLLADKAYRQRLLPYVRDPLLRSFFLDEYERYDPRWRSEAISPILNKVGQFLSAPVVRHVVGQSGPGFNLRELMDRGGIFIANLASGRIGEDNCDLLGGLLIAGFQLAAMSRANQPEAERRDFYLLVDEFQHFANDAFSSILSEARKYRLALTLSHQYLDQVPPEISEAVFGNVGSLAAFRMGAGDVTRLAREFAPVFDGQDLVHLPNHHFCARLARPRGTAPSFSARTVAPQPARHISPALIQLSRQRWARPRAEVELDILDLWDGRSLP